MIFHTNATYLRNKIHLCLINIEYNFSIHSDIVCQVTQISAGSCLTRNFNLAHSSSELSTYLLWYNKYLKHLRKMKYNTNFKITNIVGGET